MLYCACGYCGTGSSAVYHLLSEYQGIANGDLGEYEHVLMYTPHGLFDLEDALYRNNGWHNFDAAITEFRAEMKRLNDNDFSWFGGFQNRYGDQFMNLVDEFINKLVQYTIPGYWSYDLKGWKFDSVQFAKDTVRNIQGQHREHPGRVIDRTTDNQIHFSFIEKEDFYKAAGEFIQKYFEMMYGKEEKIVLNQFLLPHNLYRLKNYFGDGIKSIIVDRDPRDAYIIQKYVWPTKGIRAKIPTDIDQFCRFWVGMRRSVTPYDPDVAITMKFEDFVYHYDETVAKVEEFFGVDARDHISPKKHLNPAISISNTQNWLINDAWKEEAEYIAERLPEYLYDFPYEFKPKLEDTKFL